MQLTAPRSVDSTISTVSATDARRVRAISSRARMSIVSDDRSLRAESKRREALDLDQPIWYAVFLSSFLIGLLLLGSLWIALNLRLA